MIEKVFLKTDKYNSTSCILTNSHIEQDSITYSIKIIEHDFITYSIKIFDANDSSITLYSTIDDDENDFYELNTLIQHISNLRDRFLFMRNNKENIFKTYKTKEEAQQFLDYLKEKDNLLFEKYVVKTFGNKKETYYRIVCTENVEDFEY